MRLLGSRFIEIVIKHELVEFVVHLLRNWRVVCSNLDLCKITFFLLKSFLAWMWRAKNPNNLGGR